MTYQNFMVNEEEGLSDARLFEIISTFQTTDLPILKKLKNYYDGRQDIIYKAPVDEGRPDNRLVVNYCKMITDNYNGYMMGKKVSFTGENVEKIQEVLDYNDIHETLTEYLRQALIYGRAFLINYIDKDGQQRVQVLDSRDCIPVYDDTIEHSLLYVIRCWEDTSYGNLATSIKYKVEVYGPDETRYYNATAGFNTYELTSVKEHHYEQCPITVFSLNRDETGVFQPILSLQDAVNEALSSEIDNFSDFADAYLVLTGMEATDEEGLADMKRHRCILLSGDGTSNASFLTKNVADTQIENILTNLNTKIYSIAQCPDFSDPQVFGSATSGIALKFKLMNFEDACSNIESEMRKAIQRMIELIVTILHLTNEEETWRDIQIIFRRNLPTDMTELLNIVNSLRGIVSTETLLGQIPFIDSPAEELEKLKAENDILQLYNFEDHHPEEEGSTEEDNEV